MDPDKQENRFLDPEKVLKEIGLQGNMSFADFGCGGGYFSLPAAKMVGDHGHVYAVDILKSSLGDVEGKAKLEGLRNLETIWADLEVPNSTKLRPDSVDIVFVAHVFYQSDKQSPILQEAKRVVKPGGKIVVVEWEKVAVPFGPPLEKRISKDEALQVAKAVGLVLEDEFAAGSYHYGLLLRKIESARDEKAARGEMAYE